MNLMPYLVDWNEINQRKEAGTLEKALEATLEEDVPWFQSLDLISDNDILYTSTAEAYEHLCAELPDNVRIQSDAFFNRLFTFQDYCQDLDMSDCGEWGSLFVLILSPESVAHFKAAADSLNFELLRDAYYWTCEADTKEAFAEWMETEPDQSFESGFLPYIQTWRDGLDLAVNTGKGIMVKWA